MLGIMNAVVRHATGGLGTTSGNHGADRVPPKPAGKRRSDLDLKTKPVLRRRYPR